MYQPQSTQNPSDTTPSYSWKSNRVSSRVRSFLVLLLLSALLPLKAQVGKVGINTTSPAATLHVADSSVVFTGLPVNPPPVPGPPPVSGPGSRMMWYADKIAFRAGGVQGTQWDKDSVGVGSAAFGVDTKATGILSFVGGGGSNTASGQNSFAGGGTLLRASGPFSYAGGGDNNQASGTRAFVGGGRDNVASGVNAFAGGGDGNTASGDFSFIGGGGDNFTLGVGAFIGGGSSNAAFGVLSFLGGGSGLLGKSFGETVFGLYNTDYTPASTNDINANDRLFVIGNGTAVSERSNAVTVLKNGRVGIGTDTPDLLMEIRGPASSANGATLAFGGTGSDQEEAGRIRFLDGTASNNWRGIYMHHDGTLNKFHIGVHSPSTNNPADDLPILTIERGDNQVGINTTTPGFLFEVNGSAGKPGGGSWGASSDARLKTDVAPYSDGLASVLSIDPVTYRYNELSGYDPGRTYVGVIAQQLQEVAPYMVSVSDRVAADGQTGYLTVDNSAMTYMLINAVKEQQAIIEELKRTIETLSAEVAEVKARGVR